MKQVFKCDYCSQTGIEPTLIQDHETKCTFNPVNKSCYTCKHSDYDYDLHYCKIKVVTVSDHIYDDVPCKSHQTKEE